MRIPPAVGASWPGMLLSEHVSQELPAELVRHVLIISDDTADASEMRLSEPDDGDCGEEEDETGDVIRVSFFAAMV